MDNRDGGTWEGGTSFASSHLLTNGANEAYGVTFILKAIKFPNMKVMDIENSGY